MTKSKQYQEYVDNGGTMTMQEWEQDGRYDPGADIAHTPGPWIEERHKERPNTIVDIRSTDDTKGIAIMFRTIETKAEFESNIKLIKSAPKMLEALKTARAELLKTGITVDNADVYNIIDHAIKGAEL